jgi:hypothetical protein
MSFHGCLSLIPIDIVSTPFWHDQTKLRTAPPKWQWSLVTTQTRKTWQGSTGHMGRLIYVTSYFNMNLLIMNIANQWAFLFIIWADLFNGWRWSFVIECRGMIRIITSLEIKMPFGSKIISLPGPVTSQSRAQLTQLIDTQSTQTQAKPFPNCQLPAKDEPRRIKNPASNPLWSHFITFMSRFDLLLTW